MESVWFYVIAVILGITLILVYLLFAGPSTLAKDISGFFSGIASSIMSGFKTAY
ncbi:MAG: hypothetical protein M1284_00840 [Candidatus Parvarchaeota archaeon]|jgi:hypothetical protein|nr:hypothetical protein [Candidatus Parvarchaeota archaeon]MCL5420281.1 hypothetical protein [Candidatus Parvarchaeota archaeon]